MTSGEGASDVVVEMMRAVGDTGIQWLCNDVKVSPSNKFTCASISLYVLSLLQDMHTYQVGCICFVASNCQFYFSVFRSDGYLL